MEVERKYGVATTVLFPLIDRGTLDFESTPVTFVAADTQLMKDEAAFANTGSTPAHEGNGIYSLALTATEMQFARGAVTVIDAATKTWEDQAIVISTYGHPLAQDDRQGFNAMVDSDIATKTSSTVYTITDAPGDNNALLDMVAVFFDADGDQSAVNISAYVGTTKEITVSEAPTFTVIVGDKIRVYPTADAATAAQIADAIADEDIVAAHGTADTLGFLIRQGFAAIAQRTNNNNLNALLGVSDTAAFDLKKELLNIAITGEVTNSVFERLKALDDQRPATGTISNFDESADRVILTSAEKDAIADHILRRSFASMIASADGDAKSFRSLAGAVAKLVNKLTSAGGTLTINEDDDTTALGTQAITENAAANPITEVDTN